MKPKRTLALKVFQDHLRNSPAIEPFDTLTSPDMAASLFFLRLKGRLYISATRQLQRKIGKLQGFGNKSKEKEPAVSHLLPCEAVSRAICAPTSGSPGDSVG